MDKQDKPIFDSCGDPIIDQVMVKTVDAINSIHATNRQIINGLLWVLLGLVHQCPGKDRESVLLFILRKIDDYCSNNDHPN